MNTHVDLQYVPEDAIDARLDCELRGLLCACFTKPEDAVFRHRRYFLEPPQHRWLVRDTDGQLVGHAVVHEKEIIADQERYNVGGVAEVCVHPDSRRQGLAKLMLAAAHEWMAARGFSFAILFGEQEIYGSSGYSLIHNLYHDGTAGLDRVDAMVRALSDTPWPASKVYLPGPKF